VTSIAAKPILRGWIHAAYTPLVLAAVIVLVVLSPTGISTAAAVVFAFTALGLFGTSAVYHIGNGRMAQRVTAVLQRIDHANIFLIIAGTYTPLAVLLLPANSARNLLLIIWSGAILGLLVQLFWSKAPRWVYVPVYIALGWVAVAFMNQFAAVGGWALVALILGGGIAYTLGAVIYGMKRPNPSLKWFGFHEIFHTFTVIGFAYHIMAIFIAAIAAR
jgi:hemolysin III